MAIRLPAGPPLTPRQRPSGDGPGPDGSGPSPLASEANLRPEIAVSWWRSELLGVRPELAIEALASEPLLDADERLRRAVQPVLDELVTRLAGTNSAIVLGDHRAVILDRRGTTPSVNSEMDRVGIFPGYAFAEWSVGTNAIGTAAEERRLVRIAGTEHYAEVFKHLSCYGVPLVHPLNRRLVGIFDLTFPACDEHPLMRSFMHDAGQRIEGVLAEWTSLRERAQFECFLSLGRRSRRPVLSTMDEAVLLNRSARDLHPVDQAALIAAAGEIGDAEHGAVLTLPVHDDSEPLSVRVHTHSDLARFPGVILEVLPAMARRRPARRGYGGSLPGLVGASKAWTAFCAAARCAADAGTSVAITGEVGSGRLAVARALHDLARRTRFTVVDAASAMADGRPAWLRRLREQLADADTTVVVRHLERCDDALAAAHFRDRELLVDVETFQRRAGQDNTGNAAGPAGDAGRHELTPHLALVHTELRGDGTDRVAVLVEPDRVGPQRRTVTLRPFRSRLRRSRLRRSRLHPERVAPGRSTASHPGRAGGSA